MARRILSRPDIEDKGSAISRLTGEFVDKIKGAFSTKEQEEDTKELDMYYKEIEEDYTKAIDDDFAGGCPHCLFGDEITKEELSICPYCLNDYGSN